jgi:hypothetical protein
MLKYITQLIYSEFKVQDYDEMCEEFSKIEKIVPLQYSVIKIIFFGFLNIITAFFITLFLVWFPKLQSYFLYETCKLKNAKFVGIYGTGIF